MIDAKFESKFGSIENEVK